MTTETTTSTVPSMEAMIVELKAHAIKYYNIGRGWDLVIETMDDAEIADIIRGARTMDGAKRKMARYLNPIADHRREIEATAW